MTNYQNPEVLKDPGNFAGRRSHVLEMGVENLGAALRRKKESETRLPRHPLLNIDSYVAPGSRNTVPVYNIEDRASTDSENVITPATPDELVQQAILDNIAAIHEAKMDEEILQ